MTTAIKYKGIHRNGVFIAGDVFCDYGQTIEAPDDVAASLIEQGGWEAVKPPKSTPKADKADSTETEA